MKSTPRHTVGQLPKIKDKILKAAREKWPITYRGKTIQTAHFSSEIMETRSI